MNINLYLQTVSFIELGCADESSTNVTPVKNNDPPNVVPSDLPNDLALPEDYEILYVNE